MVASVSATPMAIRSVRSRAALAAAAPSPATWKA
jgi:hypothetical protein